MDGHCGMCQSAVCISRSICEATKFFRLPEVIIHDMTAVEYGPKFLEEILHQKRRSLERSWRHVLTSGTAFEIFGELEAAWASVDDDIRERPQTRGTTCVLRVFFCRNLQNSQYGYDLHFCPSLFRPPMRLALISALNVQVEAKDTGFF